MVVSAGQTVAQMYNWTLLAPIHAFAVQTVFIVKHKDARDHIKRTVKNALWYFSPLSGKMIMPFE